MIRSSFSNRSLILSVHRRDDVFPIEKKIERQLFRRVLGEGGDGEKNHENESEIFHGFDNQRPQMDTDEHRF